jgi:signal peptidase I
MEIPILLAFVLLVFAVQSAILWLAARICRIPDVGLLRATKTVAVLTTVQLAFAGLVLAIEMGPKTIADNVPSVLPLLFSLAAILAQLGIMWGGLRWLLRTTWPKAAGAGAIWWGLCMASALCLALSARMFVEAFVIPTGAMAPTILGKHKEVICPTCGYRYEVNASDRPNAEVASGIYHATCPMCRFTADLAPNNPQNQSYPTYDGDRVLVAKFPYEFADPKRWDIIVFKYPGDATLNYIKRLVGLPGETIRIHDGDLWIHEAGQPEGHFEIARKPPEKILAMLQPVYDNDLAPMIAGKLHWPARWTPEPGAGEQLWTNKDLASFETDGRARGEAWIRYRHRVPAPEQWDALNDAGPKNGGPSPNSVKPQLISDFTAYNTADREQSRFDGLSQGLSTRGYGIHWVGELALQFDLESKSASGKVVAELIKGGRPFQCRFDLSSGKAELAIGGGGAEADGYHRTATTAVAGTGRHAIIFANIDDELTLWVDEKVVALSDPAGPDAPPRRDGQAQSESEKHPNQYNSALLNNHVPTVKDLAPVGIAAEGAAVKVSHIKVLRDIYYIAVFNAGKASVSIPLRDYLDREPDLADLQTWPEAFQNSNMRTVDIRLDPRDPAHPEKDRFFVLGDNSAQSSDGRLWVGQYWVDRKMLIGRATWLYWPMNRCRMLR